MTAHLLHGLGMSDKLVLMRGKRCSHIKDYGYGIKKQLVPPEIVNSCKNIFAMQIDPLVFESIKHMLNNRNDITYLIHDTVEFSKKNPVYHFLKKMFSSEGGAGGSGNGNKWKIITIRNTIQKHLKEFENIDSEFIYHPWYDFPVKLSTDLDQKNGAAAVTRLDYKKNVAMMFDTNDLMPQNHENIIYVYGAQNSAIYNYHVLKLDRLAKYWKGKFELSFEKVSEILAPKKFLVNLSNFKKDGGGTEYSTMEGIYHNCGIIIHRKWIEECKNYIGTSDFEEGYNCFAVDSAEELKNLLIKNPDIDDITKNARKMLDEPRRSFKNWKKYVY